MTTIATSTEWQPPRTADLVGVLEAMLAARRGRPCPIERLERCPSAYRTSFALEEVDLRLTTGESLRLILKDLSPLALDERARRAKPFFVGDAMREIEVYRRLLDRVPPLGVPALLGAEVDPSRDRYWLVIERVPGIELYQVGDFEVWRQVARWLARMHHQLAPFVQGDMPHQCRLLRYSEPFIEQWISRAYHFLAPHARDMPPGSWTRFEHLVHRYPEVVQRIAALPPTILHGEFYPSNVLVQNPGAHPRVCPVDWEVAAVGPGAIDLAALVSGDWTDEQKRDLAITYAMAGTEAVEPRTFLEDLACCRLHLAVQWLGWSDDWTPPREHAHDWLGEALRLMEELDL